MHSLIDADTVETIRTTGNTSRSLPNRIEILEAHHLPYDRKAENVIITGCQILGGMFQVLRDLAGILDRGGIGYTFLSREFCCGNNLYRPAIKAKDEEAIAGCRSLSKEFIGHNIEKAKDLGARRIVVFCSPCYPIYRHAFPHENIVFYPQAIDDAVADLSWNQDIDYYAGCYRLHGKLSPVPMDLKSTDSVFEKIRGLSVNRISTRECCYRPDGLDHVLNSVRSNCMVHVCTGCYFQAILNMPKDRNVRILMLPEFIRMVQQS